MSDSHISNSKSSFDLIPSPGFADWLADQETSLAFTTYFAGRLFMVGLEENGRLSWVERPLTRCMGLAVLGNTLWVSTLYQVMRFETNPDVLAWVQGFDRIYVPRVGYVTGDLDIHDMSVDDSGRLVFVSTLFSCLATVSDDKSFRPIWKPPFVSTLAPEDRCHLNGLACKAGRPAWVTAVAQSDDPEGWREHKSSGGCVIDVATDEIVMRGLSMPHSPRWYRGKLWLNQLGTGEFGVVDPERGTFEPVCVCPGYVRGLAFVGDYALVGLSLPRDGRTFQGLPVEVSLGRPGDEPRCAVVVIDLRRGEAVHSLGVEGGIKELYDVVALPDVRRPTICGFDRPDMRRAVSHGKWDDLYPT